MLGNVPHSYVIYTYSDGDLKLASIAQWLSLQINLKSYMKIRFSESRTVRQQDISVMVVANVLYEKNLVLKYFKG